MKDALDVVSSVYSTHNSTGDVRRVDFSIKDV